VALVALTPLKAGQCYEGLRRGLDGGASYGAKAAT
jgi:hypothetical protein